MAAQVIPINQIYISDLNCRPLDNRNVDSLIMAIRQGAILPPVTVRIKEGYYELISGQHRFMAVKLAGSTTIPAYIREMTDAEAYLASISENVNRKELTTEEKGKICLKLYQEGMTIEGISNSVKVSNYICRNLIRHQAFLEESILQHLHNGTIKSTTAAALTNISKQGQVEMLQSLIGKSVGECNNVIGYYLMIHPEAKLNNNICHIQSGKTVIARPETIYHNLYIDDKCVKLTEEAYVKVCAFLQQNKII